MTRLGWIRAVLTAVAMAAACDEQSLRLGGEDLRPDAQTADSGGADASRQPAEASALGPFLALAGDGSGAYRKLATAWCAQIASCESMAGQAASYADQSSCVQSLMGVFRTVRDEIACDGTGDIRITPLELARCLRGTHDTSCSIITGQVGFLGLESLGINGQIADCTQAIHEAVAQDDLQRHALPAGASCGLSTNFHGPYCSRGTQCVASGAGGCGVCLPRPRAGERCNPDDDVTPGCDFGLRCQNGVCGRERGGEHEPCVEGRCMDGLECSNDRCVLLHRAGELCTGESCGGVLRCIAGRCGKVFPLRLGAPCSTNNQNIPSDCGSGGSCQDGRCVELPRLGAACVSPCKDCEPACLSPYACENGICVAGPSCGAGKDVPCDATWQCAPGYLCRSAARGEPRRCIVASSGLGGQCEHQVSCMAGSCAESYAGDGLVCLLSDGEACSMDYECLVGTCLDGVCTRDVCTGGGAASGGNTANSKKP